MADFNLNDPSTYRPSSPKGAFAGSYYYTVAVTPGDPDTYKGPPFYTITSSDILTEEQILTLAEGIAISRGRYANAGATFDFEITDAVINKDLL